MSHAGFPSPGLFLLLYFGEGLPETLSNHSTIVSCVSRAAAHQQTLFPETGSHGGSSWSSQHSSDRRSLWKRFRRDGGVLPANRATLACLASYGQRAIPLISSPTASRLSICRNEGKGQRSEVKPTLTFSVWGFHTLSVIFKALPRWLFLSEEGQSGVERSYVTYKEPN